MCAWVGEGKEEGRGNAVHICCKRGSIICCASALPRSVDVTKMLCNVPRLQTNRGRKYYSGGDGCGYCAEPVTKQLRDYRTRCFLFLIFFCLSKQTERSLKGHYNQTNV